jgi:glycosyltransferase involved in cell wall biosynthesis
MRIGINLLPWVPRLQAGVDSYDRNLLRGLLELDSDDTFVLFLGREAVGALGLGSVRVEECGCPVYSRCRPLRAVWEQTRFGAWIARARVEALLCPHAAAPVRYPVPVVQVVHDVQFYDLPENFRPSRRAYLRRGARAAARQAAHIIASSEFTKQRILKHLGQSSDRVTVVQLAAATDYYPRPPEEIAAVKARYGLDRPYLLCLSTTYKHKQLDRLVRAFDLLREDSSGPEQLVIAGLPGNGETEFRAALQQARHGEQIRHLGRLPYEDLPPLYSGALGLVYPSCYEGFGLPAVEAMACGCPVACSDATSLPEVTGGAALLFDCRSDRAVAAAMRRLLAEPALREDLRARGLERASSLTWTETARRTLEIVHQVGRA